MRSREAFISWIVLALVASGLAGCGASGRTSGGAADKPTERKLTIAVVPKGTLHNFWKSIHAGVVKAEKELGGQVECVWKGPAREGDREGQIQVVENFISRGVDAIVLAPNDRTALVGPVEAARRKKIPIIVIDSAIDTDDIDSYIATNNYNGGAVAAKRVGERLGGKGNVVVLRYQVGSASTEQREQGFLETLKKEFPDIVILSESLYAGDSPEGAMAKAENLITQFGDKIDAWFCPCEPVTYGTSRALANKGLSKKIKVVGFDASSALITSLRAGEIDALVVQDPMKMGYLGVKAALDASRGKKVEKEVSTGETLVTADNIDDPKMKELVSPDLSQWLSE